MSKLSWALVLVWSLVLSLAYPMAAMAQAIADPADEGVNIDHTLMLLNGVIGFIMPMFIAMVTKQHWTSEAKGITAFVMCFVVALFTSFVRGELTEIEDVTLAVLTVFSAAIVSFGRWWQPSGIAGKIEESING